MKRRFFILTFILCSVVCTSIRAQQSGHMQYGIKTDQGVGFWYFHQTLHFTAGWRFSPKNYLGIGSGCDWIDFDCDADPTQSNGEVVGIPLFLDYIHYVPFRHFPQHSFFFGIEAGGGVYPGKIPRKDISERFFPFFNPKLGIDFSIRRSIGVNFGFNEIIAESGTVLCVCAGIRF